MAPTGKRTISALPPEAQDTAQRLERVGFTGWLFKEGQPMPDPYGGIQVRDESSLAPEGNVTLYAENMLGGDKFPPLVVTADGYQIDGRTRNLAKRRVTKKGQTPVFDVIILAENFENATAATMAKFYIAATKLNKHGEKLSNKTIENVIRQVWQPGMSQVDLARQLGCHSNTVKAVVNAMAAETRLEKLNETLPETERVPVEALNRTNLSHLETKARNMYDKPYVEAARLTVQANLTSPELGDLLNELNKLHDEDAQMQLLSGMRDQRQLQIDGVAKKNPLAVEAQRRFTWFGRYTDDPSVISESGSREAKEKFVKDGWAAIGVIRKAVDAIENELRG